MNNQSEILLAFYGDDFTGSTDALEFITEAGATAVLFTETPSTEQLLAFPGLNAFGVAGKTRSLDPVAIEKILLPAFRQLKATGVAHVHYKVCSTFDSSPTIGSIGKAIDCGSKIFGSSIVPVLGGMPALGRYCLFGNLFARMGIGSNGKIYRVDRHPSMSKHPVTPSDESDLRVHLAKQTSKSFGLIDVLQLEDSIETWNESLKGEEIVIIDALQEMHLEKIGEWMDKQASLNGTLFSVGSSGIEMALGKHWNKNNTLQAVNEWSLPGKANPLLIVSGSCSPVTAGQVAWAKANGFEELELDAPAICNNAQTGDEDSQKVIALLLQQKNVIVHTGTKQSKNLSAEKLGAALGCIAKNAIRNANLQRVVVAGGDTSSYAARAIGVDAVKMIAPLVNGAPLCRAYSKDKSIDGLEISFKGGQVGAENFFGIALNGK